MKSLFFVLCFLSCMPSVSSNTLAYRGYDDSALIFLQFLGLNHREIDKDMLFYMDQLLAHSEIHSEIKARPTGKTSR